MVAFAKTEGGLQALAEEYHAFLDAHAAAPESCVSVSAAITRIGSVLCWTVCPTRIGTLPPSPISCANAKCSSRRMRSTITFCGKASKVGWRSIPISAIPTRRRNIRNSSKAALVSTAAEPAPDMDTLRLTKGWSTNGTISPRNMIPST